MTELERVARDVLIREIPPALKATIDRLRAAGVSRVGLLDFVRQSAELAARKLGRGGTPLVVLQVEAYLDRLDEPKRAE